MKKQLFFALLIASAFVFTQRLYAQAPEKMSYQAVLRSSSNVPIISTQVGMRISILLGNDPGVTVYVETHTPTTNAVGLVTIEIGNGTVVSGSFTGLNWANGTYFIKTETDPAGGSTYTITGISQLLSVPYALYALSSGSATSLGNVDNTSDSDKPVSTATQTALDNKVDKVTGKGLSTADYTAAEKTKLAGIAEGAELNVNADWNATSGDAQILNKPTILAGTAPGQMQYWNGTAWVTVKTAFYYEGATLQMIGGVPTWTGGTIPTVTSTTGKVWMDRNLGASRVATSSTDAEAAGDLYQWGRGADGHQKRTSTTTSTQSSSDTPGHGDFIIGHSNWRNPANGNLWQGVDGINNPCPSGFRIPTYSELSNETGGSAAGAFASPLKLPVTGFRGSSDGSIGDPSNGWYRTTSFDGTYTFSLTFWNGGGGGFSIIPANAMAVRCIKN
jgi:hypothetical protein